MPPSFSSYRSIFIALAAVFLVVTAGYAAVHKEPPVVSPTLLGTETLVEVSAGTEEQVLLTPNHLWIDTLEIEAPLIYSDADSEEEFQQALQNGVVHYPGTARPGEHGNAYFFGHSSDYPWAAGDYKTVFAKLTRAEVGDIIIVTDENGVPYRYVVTDSFVVARDDFSVLDQYENKKRMLSLQTSYPVGTALARLIVTAEILEASDNSEENR